MLPCPVSLVYSDIYESVRTQASQCGAYSVYDKNRCSAEPSNPWYMRGVLCVVSREGRELFIKIIREARAHEKAEHERARGF